MSCWCFDNGKMVLEAFSKMHKKATLGGYKIHKIHNLKVYSKFF